MAVNEAIIRAQEILLAQLQKQSDKLTAEIKSKESGLKDIKEVARITEMDCNARIQAAKDAYEVEKAALQMAIAPLVGLKQEVEIAKAQLGKLAQDKLDAVSAVNAAKGGAIKEADEQLAKQAARLQKIDLAIQKCKEAVASL
jgi:hypothetical protein